MIKQIDFKKKYEKYKNKYETLAEIINGGSPTPISNPVFTANNDPVQLTINSVDAQHPYLNVERISNLPLGEKKNMFNSTRVMGSIPPLQSRLSFSGESDLSNNFGYCQNLDPQIPIKPFNVRFASWNVHNFVKQCGLQWTPKGRDFRFAITDLHKIQPDILFLQEMSPDIRSTQIDINRDTFNNITQTIATHLNLSHYFISDTHYSTKPDSLNATVPYFMLCNGIFSKFPIIEQLSVGLGNNRTCAYVLVAVNQNNYIACFNVHIEFDRSIIDPKRKNVSYITTQINKLIAFVDKKRNEFENNSTYKDKVHYMVGGDFNNDYLNDMGGTPEKASFDFLRNMMMPNGMLIPKLSGHTYDNAIVSSQNRHNLIDYFMFNSKSGTDLTSNNYLIIPFDSSDHRLIMYDQLLFD